MYQLTMARQFEAMGKFDQAIQLYQQLLQQNPTDLQAGISLSNVYLRLLRLEEAQQLSAKILDANPASMPIRIVLAKVSFYLGNIEQLYSVLDQGYEIAQDEHDLVMLGSCSKDLGLMEQAKACFMKVLDINPQNFSANDSLGVVYSTLGDKQASISHYKKALALNPLAFGALYNICKQKQFTEKNEEVEQLVLMNDREDIPPVGKILLAYSLGKIHEDLSDYEQAFEYFCQANEVQSRVHPYDQRKELEKLEHYKSVFNQATQPLPQANEIVPIFIVGMPRSATTLAEQILSSHSQVFGAGEQPGIDSIIHQLTSLTQKPNLLGLGDVDTDTLNSMRNRYLAQISMFSSGEKYIIDKLPYNFQNIGLIKTLFSNAIIIHCQRDAMDTCWSIFKHSLDGNHYYSHSLESLGYFYQLYQKYMAHWENIYPGEILSFVYEDLIEDSESYIKQFINDCGIEFEHACLDFHNSSRVVRTASLDQVRQPIYKSSKGVWKNYEKQLQPLLSALQA